MIEDPDVVVCRCEDVTRGEIEQAIADGAFSLDGIKRRTRACMGLCQGRTCARLVSQILAEKTHKTPAEIALASVRPPVRPTAMEVLGGSEE